VKVKNQEAVTDSFPCFGDGAWGDDHILCCTRINRNRVHPLGPPQWTWIRPNKGIWPDIVWVRRPAPCLSSFSAPVGH